LEPDRPGGNRIFPNQNRADLNFLRHEASTCRTLQNCSSARGILSKMAHF
jgi:hypothetical protein